VSGLLNATVANAVYVEGGEVKHPVKGVVITGDVYELLKTDEVVLTSNKEVLGRYEVPAIYIPKISVAGEG
jgi:PmbA protein